MPELPEVETVRLGLARLLPGRLITNITHDWDKSFPNPPAEVKKFALGARVTAVRRRAKVLMIDLDTDYSFVVHLKMTGQLVFVQSTKKPSATSHQPSRMSEANPSHAQGFRGRNDSSEFISELSGGAGLSLRFGAGHPSDSLINKLPDKSTRVVFEFEDGSRLFFNDQRKFGWVRLMPTIVIPEIDFMKKVGPEPLEDDFTAEVLFDRLQRRKSTNIKAAILDQTVLAGIGNIYADESLWGAQIHPSTLVKNIPKAKIKKLHSEIKAVLLLSIEKGGSTDRNYVNAEGKKGSYIEFAKVFRKQNQPCPRCSTTIIKTRVAGRGTHLCPVCQAV